MDIKSVDINSICIRENLGGNWNFKVAAKHLEKVHKLLLLLIEESDHLTDDDKNNINQRVNQLIEILSKIRKFDNTKNENSIEVKNELESESIRFANQTLQEFRPIENHILLMNVLSNNNIKKLEQEQLKAEEAIKIFNNLSLESQKGLSRLSEREKDLEKLEERLKKTKQGEIASAGMAEYFIKEIDHYKRITDKWFRKITWAIILAFLGTVDILIAFLYFIEQDEYKESLWQLGAAKLALIGMLWYVVSLVIHNYNVNSHLSAVNRHRAAVARTLEDFLALEIEGQSDMLKHGTDAMFKHAPIGFIRKSEKESANPLLEIINNIPGMKSADK